MIELRKKWEVRRLQDGTVDEVVADQVHAHLEYLHDDIVWVGLSFDDGERLAFTLFADPPRWKRWLAKLVPWIDDRDLAGPRIKCCISEKPGK